MKQCTSIANTRTGAGFRSRAGVRSVKRPRVRFEEAVTGLQAFVRIARRRGPKRESYDQALRAWNGKGDVER
jgi:hypothetical protein